MISPIKFMSAYQYNAIYTGSTGIAINTPVNESDNVNFLMSELSTAQREIAELENVVAEMAMVISKCNDDHWFMINLIGKYGSNKEQTLTDVYRRMEFRKPLYEKILVKHKSTIEKARGKK